jgi:hypothetical protein
MRTVTLLVSQPPFRIPAWWTRFTACGRDFEQRADGSIWLDGSKDWSCVSPAVVSDETPTRVSDRPPADAKRWFSKSDMPRQQAPGGVS